MPAIRGVYVAAITPRREGPEIDLGAAFEMIDFLCAAGVDGIALMGSTGEFVHHRVDERERFVKLAVKRSRVPVVAGVSHSTLDGAVHLGREAARAGAEALLLMPPVYFRYAADEVRRFYACFAEQTGYAAPLLLYNIPQFASEVSPEISVDLIERGVAAGVKDSSASWANFVALRAARERLDFALLAGHDVLFAPARAGGADGIVSGVACAVPELLVALDRALAAGDAVRVRRLDARLHEFLRWLEEFPAPIGIREAASERGIKAGPHATVLGPRAQTRLGEFREWFRGWLPQVRKECADA